MSISAPEDVLLRHQFPVLDSMRAVGALAVFTTHAAFWSGAYVGHGVWGALLARLDVGVAIFFVLSGFLLSRPFLAHGVLGRASPSIRRYYYKRALRILPLYFVTVVLALGLIKGNASLGPSDWPVTLAMADTFVRPELPNGLTHMWSLAVEATFYLILPLLMFAVVGRSNRLGVVRTLLVITAMALGTVGWTLWGVPWAGEWSGGQPNQWLPSYLLWFAVGILLALVELLHHQGLWRRLTGPLVALARQPGSSWAMAIGLLMVAATPVAGPSFLASPSPGQLLFRHVLYAGVGGLLVLTGVFAAAESPYARTFSHHWSRHLGFISYGFFCLHLPVLHLVIWVTPWNLFEGHLVGIWLTGLLGSLVAAELAYRLVEGPTMRLRTIRRRPATRGRPPSTGVRARY